MMQLTMRDREVLQSVNAYRLLSQSQIARLHFPSKNTAQVRLQHLWQHGFLRRINTQGVVTQEMLYTLDTQGIGLLQAECGLPKSEIRIFRGKTIHPQALLHSLEIANIRIAFELSTRAHGFKIEAWLDDQSFKADHDSVQIDQRTYPILPDSYACVAINSDQAHRFFIEFDMGTQTQTIIQQKLRAYEIYLQTGKCVTRFGSAKIRVLFITRGSKIRLDHMRKLASALPFAAYFWISARSILDTDILVTPQWWQANKEAQRALIE